jgi:hypothetical protein
MMEKVVYIYTHTIKDKLYAILVSLEIIVYPIIIGINLPDWLDFLGRGPPAGVLHVMCYMSYELNFGM